MATTTSFKQECPSCEAQVPIKDASLVGRKIDCPKCKFRFTVEKPPAAEDKPEETKPAKVSKTTETKTPAAKTTTVKPANGKAVTGKTLPAKPANGKPATEKTTSDKVTAKTAPAAKNGKPVPKKAKAEDDDTPKKKKKKKGGGSTRTLILGGVLGVLAVVALVVAVIAFWPSKDKTPAGGGSNAGNNNNNNNPTPPKPGDGGDDPKPKEVPLPPPSIADISNILPNNTEVVVSMNAPGLLSSSFHRAAFLTPGAYQEVSFHNTFGFPLDEVQRVILAYIPTQNGVFSVMRATKPIAPDKLKAGLKLDQQPPVNGLIKYLVKAHLDSLSNLLVKGNQAQDPCYLFIADDYTLVFANQGIMDQFLADNARPKYLTQPSNLPPPEPTTTPKPPDMGGMGQPKQPMPMPMPMPMPKSGGTKMGAILNPPNENAVNEGTMEIFVREPGTQFVAFQPGGERPGRDGKDGRGGSDGGQKPPPNKNPMPMPMPMPMPGPGTNPMPGPGTNPMPGPGMNPNPPSKPAPPPPPTGSYLTVQRELKAILDKVENPNKPPLLVVAAYGNTKFAAEIGQRLLNAIPRAGDRKDSPGGGFGSASEETLKSKVEPFHDVQLLAFSLTALYESKLQATLALEARDDTSRAEMEKTVRYFGHLMPWFFKGALDSLDIKGIPAEDMAPTDPNPNPMPGYPKQPMPGYPNPMQGTSDTDQEVGKGRDGSLTLTRVDTAFVLGLEMTLKPSAYSIIMAKLDEFCVQLKSQGELVDARSHVHELAAALQEYVTANGAFPRGTIDRRPTGDRKVGYPPYERLSWMTEMLQSKYLGNGSYRNIHFNRNASWSEGENLIVAQMIVPEFLARTRADQPATVHYPNPKITPPLAATHFVGMAGVGLEAADFDARDKNVATKIGIFGYDRITKLADIKAPDKTIALIQVKPEDAAPWIAGGGSTVHGVSDDPSDPSAVKPFVCTHDADGHDGTVAVMADGKVRFIPATISNKDFRGLCAINGEKPANIDMVAPEIPPPDDAAAIKPAPSEVDPKPVKVVPETGKSSIEWKEAVSKEGGFTILMPSPIATQTKEEKEPFGPVKITTQMAQVPDTKQVYVTAFGDLPDAEAAKGYEVVCKKMLTDMNKNDKATKVASEKKITLGTVNGMEYRLETGQEKRPGEISQALIRMYLVKNRLYVVAAGALEGNLGEADALKFLDSFKITDAGSKPK